MIPSFDKIHLKFKLNGNNYDFNELKEVAYSLIKEGESYEKIVGKFLLDWLDEKDYILVKTSGSTGRPKTIRLSKQAMVNSSIATGNYLKLTPGKTALHCLPTNFIAGKMMLVRAMILGLEMDLVEPTSQPIFDYDKVYHFCAMLPMQLESTMGYLHNVRNIIVGGSSVSTHLIELTQTLKTKVFATYGMTETATHIALKPLNNQAQEPYFKTLPGVSISQDERGCLVVNAPEVSKKIVVTNDIVKLHSDTEFEWLGRIDNVINSGGIKLFPEQIEEKLKGKIKQQFFVASLPDTKLSEKLILVLESESNFLETSVFEGLNKFEIPKAIYSVAKFIMTSNGKIKRTETLKLIK
ncbi:O-succinylbenzoic acid--CoA ligase [Aquaticitalea lipolytica]|uniref:O-succinylbenzoic acid--CoA ligase n=1 Tax=Aquaticitalea lipolytica TaxID=1247562 RepID=A0A8J2TUI8_9FLAO|nr:AMP-binding protein [Aquaticitalea lipolytica]GFZ85663.1 O-succinylbenzoic acid--CoA ligase [Aquaticitalea lipolytica]